MRETLNEKEKVKKKNTLFITVSNILKRDNLDDLR